MRKNLKYTGYFNSNSGMATAARNIVMAFDRAGCGITTEIAPNVETTKNLGTSYDFCQQHAGSNIPYDVKIIHITPDAVRKHMETMKYHIFHLFWETSALPKWWVWELNHSVDEIWTGSAWNKKVFQESGVKIPIWICPQPIDHFPEHVDPFPMKNKPEFLFGSIFQFIERKNPQLLIRAFMEEFSGNRDVGLLLKTYKQHFSEEEVREMVDDIRLWKGDQEYPRIFLSPDALSQSDVYRLYKNMDCFVSAHRGEGWGIPVVEAMSAGIPVISTDLGGCHEHVPKEYWYPVGYEFCNVFNMDFVPWYDTDQQWASPNIDHLKANLREVYEYREKAGEKALKAKQYVEKHLTYEPIGEQMRKKLEMI